jgi:DNA invertase Pin-like site-specific DNA recombinase
MDGNVEFVCCDMPQATRLTIHVLAAVAEHERAIVQRTKEGLAAAKARGVVLGNPELAAANRAAARERAEALRPVLAELRSSLGHRCCSRA